MDTCPAWMLEPRDSEKRDTGPSEASPRETGRASVLSLILVWAGRERAAHQAPPPCPSFQLQAQRDVQGRLCPAPPLLTWPSKLEAPQEDSGSSSSLITIHQSPQKSVLGKSGAWWRPGSRTQPCRKCGLVRQSIPHTLCPQEAPASNDPSFYHAHWPRSP